MNEVSASSLPSTPGSTLHMYDGMKIYDDGSGG